MSKSQQKQGKRGEEIAARELHKIGVYNIEKIETPVSLIPHGTIAGYFRVIWGEKVAADIRGETESGISVLCEVKSTKDKNLQFSAFREHQPEKLSAHRGISIVVWVCEMNWVEDVYVMVWEDMVSAGFRKGKSITPIMASGLHIESLYAFR